MLDENDWRRLTRYIAGEGTADERQETERWIAAAPSRAKLAQQLRAGWERAASPGEAFDVESAWGEVVRRKAVRSAPEPGRDGLTRRPQGPLFAQIDRPAGRRRWLIMAAASVTLTLAVGTIWRMTDTALRPHTVAESGPVRTVATRPGQTADVYLSDGTRVRLGAASTLRFPATFGRARQVDLDGEGYFEVAHDPQREFAVRTTRAVARDIGTQFNVRAYADGPSTEVVVVEGAVSLKSVAAGSPGAGSDSAVLTPLNLGRVDAAGALTVVRRVNVDDYLAWMRGRLVFANAPLRDVLPQLSRWYGVEIAVGDSLLSDARLTATLEPGAESFPNALQRLALLLDARVEWHGREGKTAVLYARQRAH